MATTQLHVPSRVKTCSTIAARHGCLAAQKNPQPPAESFETTICPCTTRMPPPTSHLEYSVDRNTEHMPSMMVRTVDKRSRYTYTSCHREIARRNTETRRQAKSTIVALVQLVRPINYTMISITTTVKSSCRNRESQFVTHCSWTYN